MKPFLIFVCAGAFTAPTFAYGTSAGRALAEEFGLNTQSVSKVETDVYEIAYSDQLVLTSGCWVAAYREAAVVTSRRVIFIDANEVCDIVGLRDRNTGP